MIGDQVGDEPAKRARRPGKSQPTTDNDMKGSAPRRDVKKLQVAGADSKPELAANPEGSAKAPVKRVRKTTVTKTGEDNPSQDVKE